MNNNSIKQKGQPVSSRFGGARRGFSLVELLTVVFIISLLIAILIPSIHGARNAAKSTKTAALLRSIETGLEMFKNDNGKNFGATNGYPPSWSHPKIGAATSPFTAVESAEGRFPFIPDSASRPVVTGAHWLAATLVGVDGLGYVQRSSIRPKNLNPDQWYSGTPGTQNSPLPRQPLYIDVDAKSLKSTSKLPGRPNESLFADWATMKALPVLVDSFDQPVLYYAANRYGKLSNMVEDVHDPNNNYGALGLPYYFHQDNAAFTGTQVDLGWDFSGLDKWGVGHKIARPGEMLTALDIEDFNDDPSLSNRATFAFYVLDHGVFDSMLGAPAINTPLKASRAESYILVTAGVDGWYGTRDDVNNLAGHVD